MRGIARETVGNGMGAAGRCTLAVLVALTLAGCSYGRTNSRDFAEPQAAVSLPRGSTVAVVPFENLTNHANAGLIASDLVSTELYRLGAFRVVESTRVRNQLVAAKVDAEKPTDSASAQDLAKLLKVDAVLVGSVTEYGYQHGLREEPVVGMAARLVGAKDGTVLWASSQSEAGRGYFSRDSVNNVAQRVAERMLDGLKAAVAPESSFWGTGTAGGASDDALYNSLGN